MSFRLLHPLSFILMLKFLLLNENGFGSAYKVLKTGLKCRAKGQKFHSAHQDSDKPKDQKLLSPRTYLVSHNFDFSQLQFSIQALASQSRAQDL